MSDVLVEAGLVVGGLWDGAIVVEPETCTEGPVFMGAYFGDVGDGVTPGGPWSLDGVSLVLPGPLDLGAAGLVRQCWRRLGLKCRGHNIPRVVQEAIDAGVPRAIVDAAEIPEDERLDDWNFRHLKIVSEYLAATDLIAEAAGLKLAAGEVARWTQTAGGRWMLSTDQGDVKPALRHCRALADITDPHEALLVTWRRL